MFGVKPTLATANAHSSVSMRLLFTAFPLVSDDNRIPHGVTLQGSIINHRTLSGRVTCYFTTINRIFDSSANPRSSDVKERILCRTRREGMCEIAHIPCSNGSHLDYVRKMQCHVSHTVAFAAIRTIYMVQVLKQS